MNQRSLVFLGLAAALCSALLLGYVLFKIENSRTTFSWNNSQSGIPVFLYTHQNSLNLFRFSQAVSDYQAHKNELIADKLKKEYLREFDILWSALVSLRQFTGTAMTSELDEFRNISREELNILDPLMKKDVNLSSKELNQTLATTKELMQDNIRLGVAHGQRIARINRQITDNIEHLQHLSHLLSLTLFISLASTFFLIWRLRLQDKKQAQQLRTAHEQLTVLVEDLRSGQEETRSKNQFLAAVSHDLRQPLHALGLFLNSLERSVKGTEGHRLLDKIRSSTASLNGLFNGLLDISRLDAGVVEVESGNISLQRLFNELRSEYSETAEDQNTRLHISNAPHYVVSDNMLLTRIVRNLVENALLHAPGSEIRVEAQEYKASSGDTSVINGSQSNPAAEHGEIEIIVSDTGPGIPEVQREVVFSEYYQLNNPERDRNKGLGLGLSIVKRLSNLLEHNLQLTNNPAGGTIFKIRLPISDPEELKSVHAIETSMQQVQNSFPGLCVVVIDDEADIRDGMKITLGNAGCDVHACESAEQARAIVVNNELTPNLIIADYRLREGETGDAAVELLREELSEEIPALLITGDTSPTRLKEATESQIRLLHKPVLPNELFQVIGEVAYSNSLQ